MRTREIFRHYLLSHSRLQDIFFEHNRSRNTNSSKLIELDALYVLERVQLKTGPAYTHAFSSVFFSQTKHLTIKLNPTFFTYFYTQFNLPSIVYSRFVLHESSPSVLGEFSNSIFSETNSTYYQRDISLINLNEEDDVSWLVRVCSGVVERERSRAHFHTRLELSYGLSARYGTHEKRAFVPFSRSFSTGYIIFYYHVNASARFQFPS